MTPITIREATTKDLDAILALWASIDRHTGLPDKPQYLQQFLDFSPDLFLVAESALPLSRAQERGPGGEGYRIVGTVIGGWDGWRAQIARLATDPSLRRSGVARRLVDEIERRLYAKGARRIYALVDRRSPPAIPFWESAGYTGNDNIIQYSRNLEE